MQKFPSEKPDKANNQKNAILCKISIVKGHTEINIHCP